MGTYGDGYMFALIWNIKGKWWFIAQTENETAPDDDTILECVWTTRKERAHWWETGRGATAACEYLRARKKGEDIFVIQRM